MPGTELIDEDGELLSAGTGSAADTDRALMDDISESQGQTVNNSSTAVGAHHEQLLGNGVLFELLLFFHRNIIAEQHNIDVLVESVLGNIVSMTAGNRDERQVDLGISLEGGSEGGGIVRSAAALLLLIQLLLQSFESSSLDLFVFAIQRYEEIVGVMASSSGLERPVTLAMSRSRSVPMPTRCFLYARDLLQLFGDDHQGNGVVVGVGFDLQTNQCRFLLIWIIFLSEIYTGQDICTGCFAKGDNIHRSRR